MQLTNMSHNNITLMKSTKKITIKVKTDLDKGLESFQSKEAKHELELVTIAVGENNADVVEKELDKGIILVTVVPDTAGEAVKKSLLDMGYEVEIVDRKAWLLAQKKIRNGSTAN
jgi:hypothetical protein